MVGLVEVEIALAVPEAVLQRHRLDIVGGHEIALVGPVYPADAGDVGRYCDFVVGYALGCPHGTFLPLAATEHLEEPDLLRVRHRQALSSVDVAVLLREFTHELYCIAGIVAALEGQAAEFLDEEDAVAAAQGVGTGEGRLSYGHLLLVEGGIGGIEVCEGLARLGDLSRAAQAGGVAGKGDVAAAPVNGVHRALGILGGRLLGEPGAGLSVAGMRSHHASVGGGQTPHRDAGAIQIIEFTVLSKGGYA